MQKELGRDQQKALPPSEQLQTILGHQVTLLTSNPHFLIGIFSEGMLNYSKLINLKIRNLTGYISDLFTQLIKEGQDQKEFKSDISAEELSTIIIGAFRFKIQVWRISDFNFELEAQGEDYIKNIISLIQK